jgi:hypothetical protein
MTSDATGVFAALITTTNYYVIDIFSIKRAFVDDRLKYRAKQIVRTDTRELTAITTEG